MPITLNQIATNTATIVMQIGDDTVNILYYPGRVTERVFAKLNAFSTMNETTLTEGFAEFNKMLANLIKSWDVMEEEAGETGKMVMFPIDPTRFDELPLGFRINIIQRIMADIHPETVTA